MKKKVIMTIILIAIIAISALCIIRSFSKLTYLEYEIQNDIWDEYITVINTGDVLIQEFKSPYSILAGVSIKIGTFDRDNNSLWSVGIIEPETNTILYEKNYNASLIADNAFHFFEFDKKIHVKTDKTYQLRITAQNIYGNTNLAFYNIANDEDTSLELYYNDEATGGKLCFSIYGSNIDYWWMGYIIIITMALIFILFRGSHIICKREKLYNDRIFMAFVVGFIVILLLNSFSTSDIFSDEYDNITGGMIIANGGVLYRDYVTQHTPIAYYICAVFALLGAGSVQQFRLSYYLLEALIWGGLYYRHSRKIGKEKMLLLSISECIFISSMMPPQSYQILSDGIQGICMVTLLLEFLEYYRDRELNWNRVIIVSLCIWGSFGAAFVSIYAIIWPVLAVFGVEICNWVKNDIDIKSMLLRYYKLLISLAVPLILFIIYFMANHCLIRAFDQFYVFNREVYPQYILGFGNNILQPFSDAVVNTFGIIGENIGAILNSTATTTQIMQAVICLLVVISVVKMGMQKCYVEMFVLVMAMCGSATRGYDFHGLAAWYIAIMIIVLYINTIELFTSYKEIKMSAGIMLTSFLLSTYTTDVGNNLSYKQDAISEMEEYIIRNTEEGERLFLDAFVYNAVYLLHKNREPVNRAMYILPWYMDWYEEDSIEDLRNNSPDVVVYCEDKEVWGYTYYSNALAEEIREEYKKVSDNPDEGWKYDVWLRRRRE